MAFVTLHPQHAHVWSGRHHKFSDELKGHAKSRLPGFACPEWIDVVPELPVSQIGMLVCLAAKTGFFLYAQKTSTGKILKTELRKVVAKL